MNGCLVIHGLTGTPATVAAIAEALLLAGFRVSTPCLAGHGSTVEDLSKSSWMDWYETVRIAFANLRRDVDRVFCAGQSLGALLCLKLALDEGWGVRALALMATPLRLSLSERVLIRAVQHSPLLYIIKKVPKDFKKSVAEPAGQRLYKDYSLPEIPTNSVLEIMDLQRVLIKDLPRLSNPVLLLHGRHDRVAPISNVDIVQGAVASDIVETIVFERSRHVITMDWEKDDVARSTVEFFKRFA